MGKYYLIPGNNEKNCVGNGHYMLDCGSYIKKQCNNCKFKNCCIKNQCEKCSVKKSLRKYIIKCIKRKKQRKKILNFLRKIFLASSYAPYPEAFIEKFL